MAQRVRVASYNVRSFRGGVDSAAEVLAGEVLDVVFIQECGPRPRLTRLAELLGMQAVSSHRLYNRVRNGVLFRSHWHAGRADVCDLTREGRTIRRGFIAVPLRSQGLRLTAVSAHLGLGRRERERHIHELTDHLAGIAEPIVMGMDLNEGPEGPASRWVAERLFDAFAERGEGRGETFPAPEPTTRIDYIFSSAGLAVARAWVVSGELAASASDHRPVVADLDIEGP